MNIISFDIGSSKGSFNYSIWKANRGKLTFTDSGRIANPIKKQRQTYFEKLEIELIDIKAKYDIKCCFCEGYIEGTRRKGRQKGNVGPKIGISIGILYSVFRNIEVVYPSSWKTWIKKNLGNDFQKILKRKYSLQNVHQADSAGIMLWFINHPKKRFAKFLF